MFKNEEKKLVEKYGEKAVINIETGEIKEAEEEENKE